MKKIILFSTVLLIFCSVSLVQAGVGVSRTSITAPGDRQTAWSLSWRLYGPTGSFPSYTSASAGVFLNGVDILGIGPTISTLMTYNATTNRMEGRVTETLTIPVDVLKKAKNAGLRQIQFMRFFSGIPEQGSGTYITISLTSAAGSELSVTRMRLYFKNKRGEITVNRNEKGLKTFADISYTGKGLFKGYWEVDNRIVSYVNKHLVYGKKLTISTPNIPALPTFSEGTHTVKFIIQSPDQGSTMPKAIYYVRPFEAVEIVPIAQISPYNRAPVDYSPFTFKWGADDDLYTYLLEFTDTTPNKTPIFSAYTRNAEYALPPYVLKHYFKSGKRYFWKIKGFDSKDIISGESDEREFRFRPE